MKALTKTGGKVKIKYQIAQGHQQGELKSYKANRSGQLNDKAATEEWVRNKYGSWIEDTLGTTDYVIEQAKADSFVIDFDRLVDGVEFMKQLGGRDME